jgi:hypothetical protein
VSDLVSAQPVNPVEVQPDFPVGAPIKGKVYVMDHTYAPDQKCRIIVMSEDSWGDFGTKFEMARRVLKAQDDKIKTMIAEGNARERVNADLLSRLDALRAIRRAEKRPEIEADLNLPKGT